MNQDEWTPVQKNAINRMIQTEVAQKAILFGLRYGTHDPYEVFLPSTVRRAVRYVHDYYYGEEL